MNTNIDGITAKNDGIINMTTTPTSEAFEAAALCESVRIEIINLTPSTGPVEIPVRIETTMEEKIEALEEAIWNRTTDPIRFQLLQDIYRIMQ